MTTTIEPRDESADYLTGSTGASDDPRLGRVERRRIEPGPGWYRVSKAGAFGPYADPSAAKRQSARVR